jgi:hypothetical protein
LRGASLEPRWALARARQALEDNDVSATDDLSDGDLDFEQSLTRISLTGALLPYTITGDIRAETVTDGLAVTASTGLGTMLGGFGLSLVGITVFFSVVLRLDMSTFYWVWLGLAALATGVHVWQAANALRRMTAAATTL